MQPSYLIVSKLVSMPTKPRTKLWPLFTSGSGILVVGIRTHPRQETTSEVPWCLFLKDKRHPRMSQDFFPRNPKKELPPTPPILDDPGRKLWIR